MILSAVNWKGMKRLAHEYRDFAIYLTPQNVTYYISQAIPVLILARFFGVATAGIYTLGLRMTQAPFSLLRNAIYQVLLQKLTESHNLGKDLHPLFVKATIGMAATVVLPAIIVFISGPPLFALILGERWFAAGEYARWLVLLMIPWFSNVPGSILARVFNQQRNLFSTRGGYSRLHGNGAARGCCLSEPPSHRDTFGLCWRGGLCLSDCLD